jgi:uncharacterized membrane protein
MTVGFIAGALYPAVAGGLYRLWPNTFTGLVWLYSMLIMPFVFCGFYPMRLVRRGATRHAALLLIAAVLLGALSLFFSATMVTPFIYEKLHVEPVRLHSR